MIKKMFIKLLGVVFSLLFVLFSINVDTESIFTLPAEIYATQDDLNVISSDNLFGKYVTASLSDTFEVGVNQEKIGKLFIKLFGIIPIKEVSVNIAKDKHIYVGGIPLGFSINTKGVIIVGENSVNTENGTQYTSKSIKLKNGDIITKVNGVSVCSAQEIQSALEESKGKIKLEIMRDEKVLECEIQPLYDKETQTNKLGLWVRNDASGIGTLTFVDAENNRFGALGHPITDYETGVEIPVNNGKIYNCSMVGIKKGKKGEPGELRCLFMQGKNSKGQIEKNSDYGVYGTITNKDGIIDENLTASVSSRVGVRTGKAYIVSSVSGVREEYEVEIIKVNYQPKESDKSFIFRVKDKRLIDKTGGIVQGMSGSPILQDGNLIGAVTHVFVSDPTKGYGIYVDWMLAQ